MRFTAKTEKSGMTTKIPQISHLQFLVLDIMIQTESTCVSASLIRESLAKHGDVRGGPKFYQLMRRLSEDGLLVVEPTSFEVAGGQVTRTLYRLTEQGREAWRYVVSFYAERLKIAAR